MSYQKKLVTRRDFLKKSSTALAAIGGLTTGCSSQEKVSDDTHHANQVIDFDPSSWWHKEDFIIHKTVDTSYISRGTIRACVDGSWRKFKVVELPDKFVNWSLNTRVARLGRMLKFGGMDPRDLAGSHNACVATYGGPVRDSAVSLNTAYKGMGFAIQEMIFGLD